MEILQPQVSRIHLAPCRLLSKNTYLQGILRKASFPQQEF